MRKPISQKSTPTIKSHRTKKFAVRVIKALPFDRIKILGFQISDLVNFRSVGLFENRKWDFEVGFVEIYGLSTGLLILLSLIE